MNFHVIMKRGYSLFKIVIIKVNRVSKNIEKSCVNHINLTKL